jgi:hypothetical protein
MVGFLQTVLRLGILFKKSEFMHLEKQVITIPLRRLKLYCAFA